MSDENKAVKRGLAEVQSNMPMTSIDRAKVLKAIGKIRSMELEIEALKTENEGLKDTLEKSIKSYEEFETEIRNGGYI